VPKEWSDKYRGKFDAGWDVLREKIFAGRKEPAPQTAATTALPRSTACRAFETAEFLLSNIDDFGTPRADNQYAVGWGLHVCARRIGGPSRSPHAGVAPATTHRVLAEGFYR